MAQEKQENDNRQTDSKVQALQITHGSVKGDATEHRVTEHHRNGRKPEELQLESCTNLASVT